VPSHPRLLSGGVKGDLTPKNASAETRRTTRAAAKYYSKAQYWHGTGRYKYDAHRKQIDVLQGMLEDGGLTPQPDDWDPKLGTVKCISLARSRIYARLYAGRYMPSGKRIHGEHGPRWVWFYYFFGTARLLAIAGLTPPWKYIRDYDRKLALWARTITTRETKTLGDVFVHGTDIEENYPILIGIRSGTVQPLSGSRVFNLHEVRSPSRISFEDITHIEVPRANAVETVNLFKAAGILTPILAIEEGEAYCRRFSFYKLVRGGPLVSAVVNS